jgi:hypothetical protein
MQYEFAFEPKLFTRYREFDESRQFNSGLVAQVWQRETNRSTPEFYRLGTEFAESGHAAKSSCRRRDECGVCYTVKAIAWSSRLHRPM